VISSYTVVDASVVCVNNEITFSASLAVGAEAAELGAWAYIKEESMIVKNKVIFFMNKVLVFFKYDLIQYYD
jgi:hypothetical protein